MEAGGQAQLSLTHSLSCLLNLSLAWNLESSELAGQGAPKISLSVSLALGFRVWLFAYFSVRRSFLDPCTFQLVLPA